MITEMEYKLHRARIDAYQASMKALYPGVCAFTPDMINAIIAHAGCHRAPTNEERGVVEQYEWNTNPPANYFCYINCTKREATTWMGDRLGEVAFGREFRDNFGGKRVPITVYGTNGKMYHGYYYKSSGDYARIKLAKRQRPFRVPVS